MLERLLTYSLPDSVRELQHAAFELGSMSDRYSGQGIPAAHRAHSSARNITSSVVKACVDANVAEVHAFVAPLVEAARTAITCYMKFLRYTEDGSITNNVEVLDWLTVSAQGDAKTKLQAIIQAFAYILEALEGMLQIVNGSAQVMAHPHKSHGLDSLDTPDDLGMMSWLVTPDALPQFHAALTAAVQSGKPWQFRQGLHLLVKILSVLQRSPVAFEGLVRHIDYVVHNYLQRTTVPQGLMVEQVDLAINELVTTVIVLRLVEAAGQAAELADVGAIAAVLIGTMKPSPSRSTPTLPVSPRSLSPVSPADQAQPPQFAAPLPPAKLRGRDVLVREMVDHICKRAPPAPGRLAARIPIHGAAGMGKTAVALAILHHESIISTFQSHRIFFSCDEFSDIDDLCSALEFQLVGKPSRNPISSVVAYLAQCPATLLILDGFDSARLCPAKPPTVLAQKMDRLASELGLLQTLTLVVTMREIMHPRKFQWTITTPLAALGGVSPEAGLQIFNDAAFNGLSTTQKRAGATVVQSAHCVPFAIASLGQHVRRTSTSPATLGAQTANGGALYLGESTIAVLRSLGILLMGIRDKSPMLIQLLFVCSHFPRGLHLDKAPELKQRFAQTPGALQELEELGLVTRDAAGTIRVPRVVRDVTIMQFPRQGELIALASRIYVDALHDAKPPSRRLELVSTQEPVDFVNVGVMLSEERKPDELLVKTILTSTAHRPYAWTSLHDALRLLGRLDSGIWRSSRNERMARCQEVIGHCHAQRENFADARERYEAAAGIWSALSNATGAAWCSLRVGQCCLALRRYVDAGASLESARNAFHSKGDREGYAVTLYALGALCVADGRQPEAKVHFKDASLQFRDLGMENEAEEARGELEKLGLSSPVVSERSPSTTLSLQTAVAPTLQSELLSHVLDRGIGTATLAPGVAKSQHRVAASADWSAASFIFSASPGTSTSELGHLTPHDPLERETPRGFSPVPAESVFLRRAAPSSFLRSPTIRSGTVVEFDTRNPSHLHAKQLYARLEGVGSFTTFNSHLM